MDETKKYIIEFSEDPHTIRLLKLKNGDKYPVTEFKSVTPYTEPEPHAEVTADAYQRGYEAGLNDKKEGKATCQYCEYEYLDETEEPCKKCCKAYMNKYKPKAKEEQIQVGDEVITGAGKAVVIGVGPVHFEYVYSDSSTGFDKVENAKKTGRHFPEIAAVLQKMKDA